MLPASPTPCDEAHQAYVQHADSQLTCDYSVKLCEAALLFVSGCISTGSTGSMRRNGGDRMGTVLTRCAAEAACAHMLFLPGAPGRQAIIGTGCCWQNKRGLVGTWGRPKISQLHILANASFLVAKFQASPTGYKCAHHS